MQQNAAGASPPSNFRYQTATLLTGLTADQRRLVFEAALEHLALLDEVEALQRVGLVQPLFDLGELGSDRIGARAPAAKRSARPGR